MKNAQWLIVFTALSLAALMCGCDIESAESSYNEVDINVEGYYANSGGRLVQQNTGNPITSMNLHQNGDGLEGVDNNGNLFKGTIGQVIDGGTASFNLTGLTTAGNEGTISGTFTVTSSDQVKMTGTWIEDAFYSTVYGVATVPNSTNDTTNSGLSISAPATSLEVGKTYTFTASGGSGGYSWSLSENSIGSPDTYTGTQYAYKAETNGTQTITVKDSDGDTDSVSVTQS